MANRKMATENWRQRIREYTDFALAPFRAIWAELHDDKGRNYKRTWYALLPFLIVGQFVVGTVTSVMGAVAALVDTLIVFPIAYVATYLNERRKRGENLEVEVEGSEVDDTATATSEVNGSTPSPSLTRRLGSSEKPSAPTPTAFNTSIVRNKVNELKDKFQEPGDYVCPKPTGTK